MVRFGMRFPDDLYETITRLAERERRSIHAEILWLIERGAERAEGESEDS